MRIAAAFPAWSAGMNDDGTIHAEGIGFPDWQLTEDPDMGFVVIVLLEDVPEGVHTLQMIMRRSRSDFAAGVKMSYEDFGGPPGRGIVVWPVVPRRIDGLDVPSRYRFEVGFDGDDASPSATFVMEIVGPPQLSQN